MLTAWAHVTATVSGSTAAGAAGTPAQLCPHINFLQQIALKTHPHPCPEGRFHKVA